MWHCRCGVSFYNINPLITMEQVRKHRCIIDVPDLAVPHEPSKEVGSSNNPIVEGEL